MNTIYDQQNEAINWENRTILIVDDVEPNYLFLKSALEKTHAKIAYAPNGTEAIKKCVEDKTIDLVLMDAHMPGLSGHAATREIKKLRNDVTVIAHTAFVFSGERQKSLDAGCDDYIAKPIRSSELIFKIKNCLIKAGKEV